MWWTGIARSVAGLNAGASSKESATLQRIDQMAAQAGVTSAALRSQMFWHWFEGAPNWSPASEGPVQWAKSNGFKGLVHNMQMGDANLQAWANGDLDQKFRDYLAEWQTVGLKVIVIMSHEPENNTGWTSTEAALWSKGTARYMKITYELNDPDIYYATCYIPNPNKLSRSLFNPRPDLNTLCGTTAAAQKVMDRTLCGHDPYPIIRQDDTIQYLRYICSASLSDYKTWGFSHFYMPEVAMFNWNDKLNRIGPLTAAQQAKRLYDDLWVWARQQGYVGFNYFDYTDVNNARGDSRTLETAEEQLQMAKIILGTA